MKKNNKSKGFTLIELMVVISIIALLSSIVLASINSARNRAVETSLIQTVKSFQTALELFKNEKGYYPGGVNRTISSFSSSNLPGYSSILKTGDFQNFSKYINLDTAFDPKKLPKNTYVFYKANIPGQYEDFPGNMIILCEIPSGDISQLYGRLSNLDFYTIVIGYKPNSSNIFSKLPRAISIFEGNEDYYYADQEDVGYFDDVTACFTNL